MTASTEDDEEQEEEQMDDVFDDFSCVKKKPPKLVRLRSPSFEGYFASRSGAIALQAGSVKLKSNSEKVGEIQEHVELMASLLREVDALRMAVRVESSEPSKKRYLIVVSSEVDHSAVIGIDWTTGAGPTVGLVLPLWSTTVVKLDGDGRLHVSRTSTLNHTFKPVSVQTLWSARQVIDKAVDYAYKHKYFEGVNTNGFLEYYSSVITSDHMCIAEWNVLDDLSSHVMGKVNQPADPDEKAQKVKNAIKTKLREVMRNLDLDIVTTRDIRLMCEKDMDTSLVKYKRYIDEQVLVVMGQMDSASKILDYVYLGSEWNATDLVGLKELGIGYILNITREVDNFFPHNMFYYNIRVYDEETTELLKHWDHTYRFIEKARENGSKVLVHCRHGISRSASTVIAYIMKKKGWNMTDTLDYVQDIRNIVQPNPGFTKQLIIYEGILNSSRNRNLFRPSSGVKQEEVEENAGTEKPKSLNQTQFPDDGNSDVDRKQQNIETEMLVDESAESREKTNIDEEDGHLDTPKRQSTPVQQMSDIEDDVDAMKKLWHSPGPQRKLRCAKTMRSGAVFIENDENESDMDVDSKSSTTSNEHDSTKLSDAVEDAVMEQVVMATHMKTELMASVKKLHDDSSTDLKRFDGNDTLEESNVKPSDLRRLSCDSQLLHFENIANMKKRKSLTEREIVKESVLEIEEEVPIECEPAMQKSKVSELSTVFMRNSKKHIKDSTRRRTLDDDCFVFNSYNDEQADEVSTATGKTDPLLTSEPTTTEVQARPLKLELAAKTEKVSSIPEAQYPRLRQSGTLSRSSTWSSYDGESLEKYIQSETYLDSATALNMEIQQLNQAYDDVNQDPSKETSVAHLVNLHDKIIREKAVKRSPSSTSPFSLPDTVDTVTALDDNNPTAFAHHTTKDIQRENSAKNLKRVQSFPKRNRMDLFRDERNDTNLPSVDGESRSLPASPNVVKRELESLYPSTNVPVDILKSTKNDIQQQQQQQQQLAEHVLLKDVKRIVNTYETRQLSIDAENDGSLSAERKRSQSTSEKSKNIGNKVRARRSSSVTVDLRSFDENQTMSSKKP